MDNTVSEARAAADRAREKARRALEGLPRPEGGGGTGYSSSCDALFETATHFYDTATADIAAGHTTWAWIHKVRADTFYSLGHACDEAASHLP